MLIKDFNERCEFFSYLHIHVTNIIEHGALFVHSQDYRFWGGMLYRDIKELFEVIENNKQVFNEIKKEYEE